MTRQEKRRQLVRKHFRALEGTVRHSYRPVLSIDRYGKKTYGPRVVTVELRKHRRAEARAFAAGEWNRRNQEGE